LNTEHAPLVKDRQVNADLVGLRLLESNLDLHALCPGRLLADLAASENELHAAVLLYVNPPESGAETFRSVITQVPGIPFVVLSGTDVHHKRALPTLNYAPSDHPRLGCKRPERESIQNGDTLPPIPIASGSQGLCLCWHAQCHDHDFTKNRGDCRAYASRGGDPSHHRFAASAGRPEC
jgi:hypothetical protein